MHEHEWKQNLRGMTVDTNPPHNSVYCECGVVGCQNSQTMEVHDIKTVDLTQLLQPSGRVARKLN